MIPDEFDIEDIADIRDLTRCSLLAALVLAEGDMPNDLAFRAVEYNALAAGWDLGVHGMGCQWPAHAGIRFTPQELETVVRLARYIVARESVPAEADDV